MVKVVLDVAGMVTGTEDLAHFVESMGIQAHYHYASNDEKSEICVHGCDGGHRLFHRLGADACDSLTADPILSISMLSSLQS